MSPRDLVAFEETQRRAELRREQASNRDFAARCPGARETDCYRRGPLPPSAFYTTRQYLRYRIDREHARWNPARCSSLSGALNHKCRR
jgi:hypothetical protein